MNSKRQLVAIIPLAAVTVIVLAIWYVSYWRHGIIAAYYEWGLTEMIVAYALDHDGRPPQNWADLSGYESRGFHLAEPKHFDAIRRYVDLDFGLLASLATSPRTAPASNRMAISHRKGADLHWINPNELLRSYFLSQEIPSDLRIEQSKQVE